MTARRILVPWTAQPAGLVDLSPEWEPIVAFACLTGQSGRSDAKSRTPAVVSGTINVSNSIKGAASVPTSVSATRLSWTGLRPVASMNDGYAMLVLAAPIAAATLKRAFSLGDEAAANYTQATISFNSNASASASSGRIGFTEYSGTYKTIAETDASAVDGNWNTIIVNRLSGASTPQIFVNGTNRLTYSVPTVGVSFTNGVHIHGQPTSTTTGCADPIALAVVFNRALREIELARISENPWQIFRKQSRVYFIPSAGGGGATITAGSGSFALTGTAVSLKANRVLAAASGSFALTGSDVSLRVGRKLAADSGTYSLTGTDVAFKRGYALSAESGTYTLNGTDVSLKAGRKLTADSGTYALTGTNVTLTHNSAGSYTLVAESGSYSLTGTAVSLTVNRKLAADSGTYALTGSNATLTKGYTLTAASGTYTLTGSNVAFARTYRLTAESGAYTLTGSNASIVWSGAPVDSGPDTSGGGSGPRVLLRERKVREEVDEWLAKKAQADLLKKIQREDEEICLIMALLAA